MFNNNYCLLCLEPTGDTQDEINIESTQGETPKVRNLLELYFKPELENALNYANTHIICRQCWQTVATFHEFCERVQKGHAAAVKIWQTGKVQPVTAQSTHTEGEEEAQVLPTTRSTTKRRRGRPRRAKASYKDTTESAHQIAEPKIEINTLDKVCIEDNVQLDELQVAEIKHEVLQEVSMDMDYSSACNESDNLPHVEGTEEDDEPHSGEDTLLEDSAREQKRKIQHKKSDEFIGRHFPQLSCCLCSEVLRTYGDLKKHFRLQHQTEGYVLCCGKKLLNRGVLVDHLHTHDDPDYFKCEHCGKAMADRRCLEVHQKTHMNNKNRIYQCDVCKKKFTRISTLNLHKESHKPERKHTCKECEKSYATEVALRAHNRSVHLQMHVKICDICGKSIRGREVMQRHMDEHAGVVRVPVNCEICNSSLTDKYRLARHMKVMHGEEYQQPQTCNICGKQSETLRAHKYHMKYMHYMQRKHTCTVCNKGFKRTTDLKEHMAIHTGDILYTCTFCPKTFNSNANMYSHRKKMHPIEWAETRKQKLQPKQNDKSN